MNESFSKEKVGLVVIDMQKGLVNKSSEEVREQIRASGVVETVRQTVYFFHDLDMPCFFVKVERLDNGRDLVPNPSDWALRGQAKPGRDMFPLKKSTEDVELIDDLTVGENDVVIPKFRVSAFYGTPLELLLRSHKLDTIVVCGIFTHLGVETTVRDAKDRDFQVIVLKDGCTSYPSSLHDHAIHEVFPRICRVRTFAELKTAFQ